MELLFAQAGKTLAKAFAEHASGLFGKLEKLGCFLLGRHALKDAEVFAMIWPRLGVHARIIPARRKPMPVLPRLAFVDASDVRALFRKRPGIRLGERMSQYALKRIEAGEASALPPGPVPVMGCDARTGIASRTLVPIDAMAAPR